MLRLGGLLPSLVKVPTLGINQCVPEIISFSATAQFDMSTATRRDGDERVVVVAVDSVNVSGGQSAARRLIASASSRRMYPALE